MKFEINDKGVKRRVFVSSASPAQLARIEASLARFGNFCSNAENGSGWANIRPRDVNEVSGILTVLSAPERRDGQNNVVPLASRPVPRCFCTGCGEVNPSRFTTLPMSARRCDDCA